MRTGTSLSIGVRSSPLLSRRNSASAVWGRMPARQKILNSNSNIISFRPDGLPVASVIGHYEDPAECFLISSNCETESFQIRVKERYIANITAEHSLYVGARFAYFYLKYRTRSQQKIASVFLFVKKYKPDLLVVSNGEVSVLTFTSR